MTYENILFDVTDGVATITLNRDDTRNALSWPLAREMVDALDNLGDARVLVITGRGKGFCSGGNLAASLQPGSDRGDMLYFGLTEVLNPMILKIDSLDIPVISAVNGAAAGAGVALALSADLVIAAASSFFYVAFAQVGLVPDAGTSWFLPRLIGKSRATELMMLAERLPAQQAQDWGLIYQCVADEALAEATMTLARRLANGPTVSYALMRRNLRAALVSDLPTSLQLEAEGQRAAGKTLDCEAAVAAFREKRAPVFQGE